MKAASTLWRGGDGDLRLLLRFTQQATIFFPRIITRNFSRSSPVAPGIDNRATAPPPKVPAPATDAEPSHSSGPATGDRGVANSNSCGTPPPSPDVTSDLANVSSDLAHVAESVQPEPPGRRWWNYVAFPCGAVALIGTGYASYWFYQSGFDFRVTRLQLAVHREQLWCLLRYGGSVRKEAVENSIFETGLGVEWRKLLVVYFLQLDLDKENGVKKSDIIALLKQAGIEEPTSLKFVKEFLDQGLGRSSTENLWSGCSIQEFTSLIESLLLQDAVTSLDNNSNKNHSGDIAPSNLQLPPNFADRLKKKLQEHLSSAVNGTTQHVAFQRAISTSSSVSPGESSLEDDDRIMEFELQQAIRTRDTYLKLESRKQLSEAQVMRLATLQQRIDKLTSSIGEAKTRQSLEQRRSALDAATSTR